MLAKSYPILVGMCGAILAANAALAAYPDKPIRLVLPQAAASATDVEARQIVTRMTEVLGQPIVIDYKAGGNGIIGAKDVAAAKPDGYTIFFGTIQTHGTNPSLQKNLPYDPIADFTPIARLSSIPSLLTVSSKLGLRSVADLLVYARSRPGKLSYASTGIGGSGHLAHEMFNVEASVKFLHVPYKNVPQALVDVSNGDVTIFIYPYLPIVPFVQRGALNVLATTSKTRMAVMPDVPTFAELGYPRTTVSAWQALYAPAGTPREIVNAIYNAALKALSDPANVKALQSAGFEIWPGTPDETAEFTRSEIERLRTMIRTMGIPPE